MIGRVEASALLESNYALLHSSFSVHVLLDVSFQLIRRFMFASSVARLDAHKSQAERSQALPRASQSKALTSKILQSIIVEGIAGEGIAVGGISRKHFQ